MALMIKYQIFIDKHLPVQTQWKVNISKKYAICSNLLTTTAISRRNYSVFITTFRYISLHLGGVTVYSTC